VGTAGLFTRAAAREFLLRIVLGLHVFVGAWVASAPVRPLMIWANKKQIPVVERLQNFNGMIP
jgi:hypothetical protein